MTLSLRPRHVRAWALIAVLALVVTAMVTTGLWRNESESTDGPVTPIRQANANAPVALWIGDSYTNGHGAPRPAAGYPCLVSDRLGWTCKLDAQGGTGFVNDGSGASPANEPLADRLHATSEAVDPDLVVIDAGRNDFAAAPAAFRQEVTAYLNAARKTYRHAKFVVIEPFILGRSRFDYSLIDRAVRLAANGIGATIVDTTNPAWRRLADRLPTVDGLHPTARSHRIIAQHLIKELRRLHIPKSIRPHTT